ncbi:hypothetical protein N7499_006820 [Penicillium canescens]|uniref:Zn(2)-C6 fungal-type domain-containing protein n=1 Tax=Penicillium canescens TaxID=5083 RepID=A0AAD6IE97_PENCN|nr:uncharacterized protein N7446_002510 [Penicillium canescens]KAJ5996867.1 hypothetical protein N7522_008527 [Penicillium canescens]KAJ6044315.1 hypothetical protein N7460_005670 [Penicillium canescens]KAJ6074733.1 hypothetical protein N7446_002510 [Penicillium canescens]KAJ6081946.1 hypothetical protein N7499_006820 [Penicillium canescens]KAJ6176259.1 hypothetical protein N7485_003173 [Penicillium canescens]
MMGNSDQNTSGTPAPYGRACTNCVRAKCKCMLAAESDKCQRCLRLNKDCKTSESNRKRKRSASSKTQHLEAKLDSIVSMLQANGANAGLPVDWEAATHRQVPRDVSSQIGSSVTRTPASTTSPSTIEHCGSSVYDDISSTMSISPAAAQENLDNFRNQNLKYLPFVNIPPHITSEHLRSQQPFFWLCIMAVLTPGTLESEGTFKKITDFIHQRLMAEASPSMDLLLGVMTFISWVTYAKRPFLNFYAHVLIGIVSDLGINKSVPNEYSTMQAFKCAIGWRPNPPTARTLEERRAVMGCFLITSSVALSMFKIDALRWTPHMEESLSVLAEAKDCKEDQLLVTLVKIQLVIDRVYHARRDGDSLNPLAFYLNSFQTQLETVKSQIPVHLQKDKAVLMYLSNAELTINEISIVLPAVPNAPDLKRLDSLYISLNATKSWLDLWLSIPPKNYIVISFVMFFQFTRAIVNLYKLSILEDPAWDRTMVRNTANLISYLESIEANLKEGAEHIATAGGTDMNILEKGLKMVQGLKQGWEPKLNEIWYDAPMNQSILQADMGVGPPNGLVPESLQFNGFDDSWMMEILGSL